MDAGSVLPCRKRTEKENVEPLPSTLVAQISPSKSSTSDLQIDKPRPVPPNTRAVLFEACEKH
jgi:hypothetical protein